MNLCTLAQVKAYLGIASSETSQDAVLNALIEAYTARVSRYCDRNFDSANYAEIRNGYGADRMVLRQWPVTAISSVNVGSSAIPAGANLGARAGYRNTDLTYGDGRSLVLSGYTFDKGLGNVQINYTAGYAAINVTENWNIPGNPGPYTITVLQALKYIGGDSITFTVGGAPLTRVVGNPADNQYSVSASGVFTFNAADAALGVTINYQILGFPADLSQAVIELVGLRYKSRSWIGFTSKTLATESISFATEDMPAPIMEALSGYRTTMVAP